MNSYCLASSSAGNCFIFEFGTHASLMVECGLPYKEIIKKCNEQKIDFTKIKSCLITHAHKDHCVSAHDLLLRGINIYATRETTLKIAENSEILEINTPRKVLDGVWVNTFAVEHDIEGACGFLIKTRTDTVLFINDCKTWNADLSSLHPTQVFIECNHDNDKVIAKIEEIEKQNETCDLVDKQENDELLFRLNRNADYHSSLKGTIQNLQKLDLKLCKEIVLMHLSDSYADEKKMQNEVMKATGIKTIVAKKYGGFTK